MKKFLIKTLIPAIAAAVRLDVETVTDGTGTYIKAEIYLLGNRIFNRRVYLKREPTGEIANQKIRVE